MMATFSTSVFKLSLMATVLTLISARVPQQQAAGGKTESIDRQDSTIIKSQIGSTVTESSISNDDMGGSKPLRLLRRLQITPENRRALRRLLLLKTDDRYLDKRRPFQQSQNVLDEGPKEQQQQQETAVSRNSRQRLAGNRRWRPAKVIKQLPSDLAETQSCRFKLCSSIV